MFWLFLTFPNFKVTPTASKVFSSICVFVTFLACKVTLSRTEGVGVRASCLDLFYFSRLQHGGHAVSKAQCLRAPPFCVNYLCALCCVNKRPRVPRPLAPHAYKKRPTGPLESVRTSWRKPPSCTPGTQAAAPHLRDRPPAALEGPRRLGGSFASSSLVMDCRALPGQLYVRSHSELSSRPANWTLSSWIFVDAY